jgi:hypothetical protein
MQAPVADARTLLQPLGPRMVEWRRHMHMYPELSFEATPERKEVRLKVDARIAPAGIVRELASLVKDFPGEAPVFVDLLTSMGSKLLELGPEYRVKPVPDFFAEVKALLGEAAVA